MQLPPAHDLREPRVDGCRILSVDDRARIGGFQRRPEILGNDVNEALAHRRLHELARPEVRLEPDWDAHVAQRVGIDTSKNLALDEVERRDHNHAPRRLSGCRLRRESEAQPDRHDRDDNTRHRMGNG